MVLSIYTYYTDTHKRIKDVWFMRFFVKPCSFSVGTFTSIRGFILLLYTRTPYTLENCPPPRAVVLLHPTPYTGHVINIYAYSFYLFIFLPIDFIDFIFSLPSLNVKLIYDDVYHTLLGIYYCVTLCSTANWFTCRNLIL